MVLRRIFGPRRDEITGEWRRLHNEELNDLYSSPNIVWVLKSRRIGLLPGGSGYFTCKQNMKLVTTRLSREGYMRSM